MLSFHEISLEGLPLFLLEQYDFTYSFSSSGSSFNHIKLLWQIVNDPGYTDYKIEEVGMGAFDCGEWVTVKNRVGQEKWKYPCPFPQA